MLLPGFYRIQKVDSVDEVIAVDIQLNPEHELYNGHFPGQPVVPGVIQLQMVKEILERSLEIELFMENLSSAKYLHMIIPDLSETIHFSIQYKRPKENTFQVTALISGGDTVYTKLKANFIPK